MSGAPRATPGAAAAPMIEARDLRKAYQEGGREVPVLRGLEARIEAGEHVAVMGRSGSGKSTLLNLLGALDSRYQGSLRLRGRELREMDERALAAFRNQTVGFVYQSFHLLPHLTAAENVALPAWFSPRGGGDRRARRARALACLALVDLERCADRRPLHLSGGERQRVAIARALYGEPPMVLCDEPTGSLDEETGEHISALFERLNRTLSVTLVVVTHDPRVAARADRVLHLRGGLLVEEEA